MPAEELFAMDEIARSHKLLRQREAEIDKKSSVVLRQNAVKKYAYLERCYGSAQIRRQSCLPICRACEMELGRGRGISNLDIKARITRPAPLV